MTDPEQTVHTNWHAAASHAEQRAAALEAEVARLRQALEEIRDDQRQTFRDTRGGFWETQVWRIADRALKGGG